MAYATSTDHAKSYILTLDENQAAWKGKLDDLKSLIKQTGGRITHEYSLVKGFSMELPSDRSKGIVEKLESFAEKLKCKLHIEEDQEVHTFSGHGSFN
ncbi:LANO_0H03114g1_1 [Lachancea nothofagi CBS 11611]|uniref:LANO_0H03114g1_1 n=1 Tax=Lachancea nothofagi CBS 11611 TaxID=1266666 RepID=A0A1G4KL86_9SACH|nr:LANO_0H03114g1_1 [Lachancea nothofagi CBS 11611]